MAVWMYLTIDIMFPYQIQHDYLVDKEYNCPKFEALLEQWLDKKGETTIDDIYELIGYTLSMNVGMKTAVFLYGPTNTGKSQFINILNKRDYCTLGKEGKLKGLEKLLYHAGGCAGITWQYN